MYQKDNQLTKSRYHRSLAKAAKKVAASDQTQKHHTKRYVLFLCQNQKHPPQDQLQLKVLLQMVQITARNLDLPNWMIPKILIIGLMIYLNNPLKKNIYIYFILSSIIFCLLPHSAPGPKKAFKYYKSENLRQKRQKGCRIYFLRPKKNLDFVDFIFMFGNRWLCIVEFNIAI